MAFFRLCAAVLLIATAVYPTSAGNARESDAAHKRTPFTVHQFPNGTWIENLAIRSNGKILATDDTRPRIYQVDQTGSCGPILVHEFPDTASVLGIVEASPDIFHVWALDGLAYLADSNLLLASDFLQGVIWSVELDSSIVAVAINNTDTRSAGFQVNGLKVSGNQLYFTTTQKELFAKVTIDAAGRPVSPVKILVKGAFLPDDFALDSEGNAYVANFADDANGIVLVRAGAGSVSQIADMVGPSGMAFGRTTEDCHVLYVGTTGGDYEYAKNGSFIGAGSVLGLDLGPQAHLECRRRLSQLSWLGLVGLR